METKMAAAMRLSGLWQLLFRMKSRLMFLRPGFDALGQVMAIIMRMRFALLFAAAAVAALSTFQGQEILANSFSSLLHGAIFGVACLLAATSVWYTSRFLFDTWSVEQSHAAVAGGHAAWLREWLPRLLGGLVIMIPAVVIHSVSNLLSDRSVAIFISAALFSTSVMFIVVVTAQQRLFKQKTSAADPTVGVVFDGATAKLAGLNPTMKWFVSSMLLLNVAALILLAVDPMLPNRIGFGAGIFVMIGTALVIVIGSLLVYLADENRIPLLGLLLLMVTIFSMWNDNHAIHLVQAKDGSKAPPQTLTSYVDARLASRVAAACPAGADDACDGRVPFVIVAAEGGGVRAAAWTARVLSGLDAEINARHGRGAFEQHLIAISGVSGGSLGGALYLAALRDSGPLPQARPRLFFEKDLMSPMLTNMLFVDNAMRFLPVAIPNTIVEDRGITFERTIEESWAATSTDAHDNTMAEPFDHLWSGKHAQLPLLLANTTVVATGERMVQAPVRLNDSDTGQAFASAIDARACWNGRDISLSAVVHNSARFTWVSPAGRFGHESACPGVRVVDGGYFENSGTASAADIIDAVVTRYGDRVKPVVVQIRNEPIAVDSVDASCAFGENVESYRPQSMPIASGPNVPLSELGDPFWALFNGRSARADQAKLNLRKRLCEGVWRGAYVEFALFNNEYTAFPLHWAIAEHTLNEMDAQFTDATAYRNQAAVAALLDAIARPESVSAVVSATTDARVSTPINASVPTMLRQQPVTAVVAPNKTRSQRIANAREIMDFSGSLRQLSIAVLGGTVLLVIGSSLRRPQGLRARIGFLWLVPAWLLLGSSIHKSFVVNQHYLAIVVSAKSDVLKALGNINAAVSTQIDHAMMALALVGIWLVSYLIWWVFHRQPENKA